MSVDHEGKPDPQAAATAAAYVDALRRLKDWSGSSYRQLEKRAAAVGDVLPRATLTAVLTRDGLPREELVAALVRACGGDAAEVARWASARRRLAAAVGPVEVLPVPVEVPPVPVEVPPVPAAEPLATTAGSTDGMSQAPPGRSLAGRTGEGLASLVPPAIGEGSWPVRALAAVLVMIVATVVTAAVVGVVRDLSRSSVSGAGQPADEALNPKVEESGDGARPAPAAPRPVARTGSTTGSSPNADPTRSPRGSGTPSAVATTVTTTTATAVADTTVVKGVPDAANGRDPSVYICGQPCARSSLAGFERKVLLKFELSGIPAGRCPTAVALRLWAKNSPGEFKVYPLAGTWSEATASWNNRPERGGALAHAYGPGGTGWMTFQLPTDTGGNAIHSFEIDGDDTGTGEFAAREDTTIAHPAELIVTHTTCS
jgi:hypothetical protein